MQGINPKIALVLTIILLTVGGGFGLWYKKTHKDAVPQQNNPSTNWNWNNDWNSPTPVDPVKPQPPSPSVQLTAPTYKDALQMSVKENKPVLIVFTATWCKWCAKMKQEVFPDPAVAALMKNYVLVYVDVDQNKDVVKKFGVKNLPAFVIADSKGQSLKTGEKYMSAGEFAAWLNKPNSQPKDEEEIRPQEKIPQQPQRPG